MKPRADVQQFGVVPSAFKELLVTSKVLPVHTAIVHFSTKARNAPSCGVIPPEDTNNVQVGLAFEDEMDDATDDCDNTHKDGKNTLHFALLGGKLNYQLHLYLT